MKKDELYVMKLPGDVFVHSRLIKPLAEQADVSRQTIRNWIKHPDIAKRKGIYIGISTRLKCPELERKHSFANRNIY